MRLSRVCCVCQSMMIAVVGEYGLLQPSGEYSEADIEWGLSNFLICVEMFLASLAHRIYFSYKDYAGLENPKRLSYVGAVVDIGPQDLLADLTAKKQD